MTNRTDIERLFKAHYAQMHRLAMVLLHDDDLARDVVHDVFAHLLISKEQSGSADEFTALLYSDFSPIPSPGYLLKAVRNRCLNHIRALGIRERVMNRYFANVDECDEEEWPDEKTIAEIYAIIRKDLPEQCRRAVELRFSGGMKIDDVAAEIGISPTAGDGHLRHAISLIRKTLRENG